MNWLKVDNLVYQSKDNEFNLHVSKLHLSTNTVLINGSNGIGKTTLFKLFLNSLTPKQGSIYLSEKLKNIVHIDQNLSLLDYLNIKENCKLQLAIKSQKFGDTLFTKQYNYLISYLNLENVQSQSLYKLSMGQKQRALILKCLITNPDLILADEPTSFQDSNMKKRVIDLLISFTKKENSKLIMISHDHEIKSYFDNEVNFDQLINFRKKDIKYDIHISEKTITT